MVTCDRSMRLLVRAADSVLDPEELDQLREHLWRCGVCRREIDGQLAVRQVLAERGDAPAPRGFGERLAARLDAETAAWTSTAHAEGASLAGERRCQAPREARSPAGWLDLLNWRRWSLRLFPVAAALIIVAVTAGRPSRPAGALDMAIAVAGWSPADRTMTGLLAHPQVSDDSALLALLIQAADRAAREDP